MSEDQNVVIHKGLDNVVIDESRLSLVNGTEGKLIYSGYKIEDLAANAQYEEVVFLLWEGRLPNRQELDALQADIASQSALPEPVIEMLKRFPADANPMAVLRTAASALSIYDADGEDNSPEANRRKAVRLTGQIASICAAWPRIRKGLEPLAPRTDLSVAANFIYMLTGEVNQASTDAIDAFMVLLTEHGMNASTFVGRATTSTGADMHSAIVSAIGTLKGPAHGGANTEAMKMFQEIGSPDNVETWFNENIKTGKRRIMGIGHRIYKALDPRAAVLLERARDLANSSESNKAWFTVAESLANLARADEYFISRNLYPNVDYYSAIVLYTLDLDVDMFTPLFAMSRIAGWTAHIMEQQANNRLMRPDVIYTGPVDLEWVDVDNR